MIKVRGKIEVIGRNDYEPEMYGGIRITAGYGKYLTIEDLIAALSKLPQDLCLSTEDGVADVKSFYAQIICDKTGREGCRITFR